MYKRFALATTIAITLSIGLVMPASAMVQPRPVNTVPITCRDKIGKIICASKMQSRLLVIQNDHIIAKIKSRFGGLASDGSGPWDTLEGSFRVYEKSLRPVSTLYNVEMPYWMAFDGAEGIHFSAEYAYSGYPYSHGCIGIKSWRQARWLYKWAKVGTRVIVTAA